MVQPQVDGGRSQTSAHPPILIIGLGNPILGDDGVGWRIAEAVQQTLPPHPNCPVEVDCLSLGGLSLMERLIGYERVILIDAMNSGQKPVGEVSVFSLDELPDRTYGHLSAAHDTTLQNALKLGSAMGARLPEQITVVAVESPFVYNFSEELTAPVAAAVPQATQATLAILQQWMSPCEKPAPPGDESH